MSRRLKDIIMDTAIVLLTLSMLFLAFLFAARSVASPKEDVASFDKLWIVDDSDGRAFTAFDTNLCTPAVIAFKEQDKSAGALVNNSGLMLTLYAVISDTVMDVFGSGSVCRTPTESYDEIADKIVNSDSFLYIEYASDLPYPYIYAMSSGKSAVDRSSVASGNAEYVSKLFLLLETDETGNTSFVCYGLDSDNNVYEFSRADGRKYTLRTADRVHLEAYSDVLKDAYLAREPVSDSPDIMYGSVEYLPLESNDVVSSLYLESESGSSKFLELFDINPEKTRSYTDSDGTTVFIGSDVRITVSPSGEISFSAENEPVLLKDLLGYSPGTKSAYTMFDMLKATNVFIGKMSAAYPGYTGDAEIKLSAIYRDSVGAFPVFEYSYYFNGIRIDGPAAFRFAFDDKGIRQLDIMLCGFSAKSPSLVTLPKPAVYERTAMLGRTGGISPRYFESLDGYFEIVWTAK